VDAVHVNRDLSRDGDWKEASSGRHEPGTRSGLHLARAGAQARRSHRALGASPRRPPAALVSLP